MESLKRPPRIQVFTRSTPADRLRKLRELAKPGETWREPYADWRNPSLRGYPRLNTHRDEDKRKHEAYADDYAALQDSFRSVRRSGEVLSSRRNYGGWYADEDGSETYTGVVCQLPGKDGKPRFVAGWWTDDKHACVGRIDLSEVYECEEDAARAGDSEAEYAAREAMEYDDGWRRYHGAEDDDAQAKEDIEDAKETIRELRRCVAPDASARKTLHAQIRSAARKIRALGEKREEYAETMEEYAKYA